MACFRVYKEKTRDDFGKYDGGSGKNEEIW